MKKILLIAVSGIVLSGCQMTGGSDTSIADTDFNAMSCEQIQQTFADYNDQMENADTATSLLSSFGVDSGTSEAKSVMNKSYLQAKKVADPVLKAKGCDFTL